jgi:hypothetical protein
MPSKGGKSANNNNRDTIVAMCGRDEECPPKDAKSANNNRDTIVTMCGKR